MKDRIKETLGILLITLVVCGLAFGIIFGVIWFFTDQHDRNDAKCKQQYGQDFNYTGRSATDCINSKGEGKFLRNL